MLDSAPSDDNSKVAILLTAMERGIREALVLCFYLERREEGREARSREQFNCSRENLAPLHSSLSLLTSSLRPPSLSSSVSRFLRPPYSTTMAISPRISSFLLAAIASMLTLCQHSHVHAFHVPGGQGKRLSTSSSLGMAPRFEKATQKWFPTNPEVRLPMSMW